MKRRVVSLAVVLGVVCAAFGAGILVERTRDSESTHVDVYSNRTPIPQEIDVRRAAEKLLDDFNHQRWTEAHEDFASFCRPEETSADLEKTWSAMQPYHFELRAFRVTEIHDDLALVDAQIILMDKNGTGPFGPHHGAEPWIKSFTFEDGRWRACQ